MPTFFIPVKYTQPVTLHKQDARSCSALVVLVVVHQGPGSKYWHVVAQGACYTAAFWIKDLKGSVQT